MQTQIQARLNLADHQPSPILASPRSLFVAALVSLYADTHDERWELYKSIGSLYPEQAMEKMIDSSIAPQPTEAQKYINASLPHAHTCNFYMALYADGVVSHYVSLKRSPDTKLWQLRSTRISRIQALKISRDGVVAEAVVSKPGYAEPRDIISEGISLTKINKGGRNSSALARDVMNFYEMQRQMFHNAQVYLAYGPKQRRHMDRMTVWQIGVPGTKGAVEFEFKVTDEGLLPVHFTPRRVRPYALMPQKAELLIVSGGEGVGLTVPSNPRAVLPYYRLAHPLPFDFTSYVDRSASDIVSLCILARLFPYVALRVGKKKLCNVYALNYDPVDQFAHAALYSKNRNLSSTTSWCPLFWLPPTQMRKRDHASMVWIPNRAALEYLRLLLVEESPDETTQRARMLSTRRLLSYLGLPCIEDENLPRLASSIGLFSRMGYDLTEEERCAITALDGANLYF